MPEESLHGEDISLSTSWVFDNPENDIFITQRLVSTNRVLILVSQESGISNGVKELDDAFISVSIPITEAPLQTNLQANINLVTNVLKGKMSTIENHAVGDAVQIMVSTNGKIIHGKNRGLGPRTWQVGGYISDTSLQKLSHGIFDCYLAKTTIGVSSGRDNTKAEPTLEFREQDLGLQLTPMDTPDISLSDLYHRPGQSPKKADSRL